MKARILSLDGVEFEGEISSFNAKTKNGEVTILNHHHPLITILDKGEGKIKAAEGDKSIFISSGFLQIGDDNTLLALIQK
ncbi:MAG: hypothetical protein O2794_01675 [bacterium]|nr:hypothetical protein [bacterium]